MALYELDDDCLVELLPLSFSQTGRADFGLVRHLLQDYVGVIAPGTLVLSLDYFKPDSTGQGVLAIDKAANLVLIEFKHDEVGAHMELRALKLAAVASSLTFTRAAELYARLLESVGNDADASEALLDFLGWSEPHEERFGQDLRIVLASSEFSTDVASSVIWLNENGLDIRCVRIKPYHYRGQILLDIAQVLPFPSGDDIRGEIKERETAARSTVLTRYNVKIGESEHEMLASRWNIWHVIKRLVDAGVRPCLEQIVLKSAIVVKDGKFVSHDAPASAGDGESRRV
jgi:hypothetical protein